MNNTSITLIETFYLFHIRVYLTQVLRILSICTYESRFSGLRAINPGLTIWQWDQVVQQVVHPLLALLRRLYIRYLLQCLATLIRTSIKSIYGSVGHLIFLFLAYNVVIIIGDLAKFAVNIYLIRKSTDINFMQLLISGDAYYLPRLQLVLVICSSLLD